MRWQRIARVVVAVIGLGAAVAIYYYGRSRPTPADPPRTLAQLDPNVVQNSGACETLYSRLGKSDVTLACATSETLSDGRTRLKQVVITGLDGSRFVLRGDSLETTGQLSTQGLPAQMLVTGHVRITTDDGLDLQSDQATYDDVSGTFTMPGTVTFTKGRVSGTSVGAIYERDSDTITFLDKASARVGANATGQGTANATAKGMSLVRGQHVLLMTGNARIVGDTQTMTGKDATWTFTEDEQAVKYVELRGAARVFPNVRGNTDQPGMNADNITMTFRPDGLTLEHATLTGTASLEMAGTSPQTIRASWIDLVLAPDGKLVTGLRAKDQLTVTLAATSTTAGRTITATTLAATGDDVKGLTQALFDGNPVFRQDPAPAPARGAAPGARGGNRRVGSASRLLLTLGGKIDAIQFAEFQQNAKFVDGDVEGQADVAKYDEIKQRLYLIPNTRDPRKMSNVKTPDMTVDAWTINLETESENLTASGSVRTRTLQSASKASQSGSLFGGTDPIIGAAESLVYEKGTGRAVYSGTAKSPAKLWQGDPQVMAEEIVYVDRTRGLTASRAVDSTWRLDPVAGDKPGTPVKTYRVRADTLAYDEGRRTAVYEGSTVFLNSADGDVEARKMTFRLAAASRTLDEMRAERDVYAQLSGGYEAVGEVLVFRAEQDAYTLLGKADRIAVLKSPASRTDSQSATTTPQCSRSESMHIDLNRRTSAVVLPLDGQAPKPTKPIDCSESLRRPR